MKQIRNWTAKRSGSSITITGKDAKGQEIRIAHVDSIKAGVNNSTAIAKDGAKYALMPNAPA